MEVALVERRLDRTYLGTISTVNKAVWSSNKPSSALKAGSTLPPLAVRTALTTEKSMLGNASLRVFSACCRGLRGRGGCGGGCSAAIVDWVVGVESTVEGFGKDLLGEAGVSRGSSSKSSSLAVVGDSGGPSAFCRRISAKSVFHVQ